MPDPFSLDGLRAVVTRAGSGIGQAAALALGRAGADVAVTELPSKLESAESTANAVRALGHDVVALPLDLREIATIGPMVQGVVSRFGRIDVLVNNAGLNIRAAREIVKAKRGTIVNIASQMGLVGYYRRAAYCSSKAGVVNLTRVLALECASHGITVNAIAPTFVHPARQAR